MKELRILRGLPGCGKSSLAKKMKEEEGAVVFNNDSLLIHNGVYKWTEEGAYEAHCVNQWLMSKAMREGVPLIVLDNTNLLPYHCTTHVRLAKRFGYSFNVIEVDTPWALDVEELARKNQHGVPASVIEEMKKNLLELPKEALMVILNCETGMCPEETLSQAQMFTEVGMFLNADECVIDYQDWRRICGYEPEGGDEVIESIKNKLEDWYANQTLQPSQGGPECF